MRHFISIGLLFAELRLSSTFMMQRPTTTPVRLSYQQSRNAFELIISRQHHSGLYLSESVSEKNNEDEEQVEPGKMRVSEIKAELELRGVTFSDCFDKESLKKRLLEARKSGKADPDLLDKFNKQRLEDSFQGRKPVDEALSDDELLKQAVGNDGNLPGGLNPDQFKKLVENPEIMTLLQSTKMQEAMKLMMTGGQEDLEAAMRADPELREIVQKLNSALGSQLG